MQHREGHFTAPDGADIYTQAWLPDDEPQAILLIVMRLPDLSGFCHEAVPQNRLS